MKYSIYFTKQAVKDIRKLTPALQEKLKTILRTRIAVNPYAGKPLVGDLKGYYSERLTFKDRIVYSIQEQQLTVLVVRAKTHYGE